MPKFQNITVEFSGCSTAELAQAQRKVVSALKLGPYIRSNDGSISPQYKRNPDVTQRHLIQAFEGKGTCRVMRLRDETGGTPDVTFRVHHIRQNAGPSRDAA